MIFLAFILLFAWRYWKNHGINHIKLPLQFSYRLASHTKHCLRESSYDRLGQELRRSGKACDDAALTLYKILQNLDSQYRDVNGVYVGFLSKLIAILILACVGRFAAFVYFDEPKFLVFLGVDDFMLQLVVLWFCLLSYVIVTYLLRHSTFALINDRDTLYDFSRSLLLDDLPRTQVVNETFCQTWRSLFKEEFRQGVSLRVLRAHRSMSHANHLMQDVKDRLRMVEALLPIVDVGIGSIVITTLLLASSDLVT